MAPEDLRAIHELLDRYCRLLDEGQDEAWLALFAPDGRLVFRGTTYAGEPGLREFLGSRKGGPGLHLNTLPAVSADGPDRVATDVPFFGLKPGDGAPVLSGVGRYRDRLRREGASWVFEERRVVLAEGF
jgi:3-phenylpropionate/cinnamic acid dioxygenase small subunit